jgi:hypothetical protein
MGQEHTPRGTSDGLKDVTPRVREMDPGLNLDVSRKRDILYNRNVTSEGRMPVVVSIGLTASDGVNQV